MTILPIPRAALAVANGSTITAASIFPVRHRDRLVAEVHLLDLDVSEAEPRLPRIAPAGRRRVEELERRPLH